MSIRVTISPGVLCTPSRLRRWPRYFETIKYDFQSQRRKVIAKCNGEVVVVIDRAKNDLPFTSVEFTMTASYTKR